MRKFLPWPGLLVIGGWGLAVVLGIPRVSQRAEELASPISVVHDWSTGHVVYTQGELAVPRPAEREDPRAFFAWVERNPGGVPPMPPIPVRRPAPPPPSHLPRKTLLHRDWSINLGTMGTAAAMSPAKFTFDVTATPSCANDFVVYPVDAIGSGTQPNLVAFNNLYSGTAGSNGFCNRTPSGSDNGVAATVLWSYNVEGIAGGGAVATSPTLSPDGTKVAFVETAAGSPAHFHVLAWKSGEGQVSSNLQNALSPFTISVFLASAPVAGSGTATDLALGTSATGTDTLSSPFVDYAHDVAYVGNDIGMLYRIKDVFCTPSNPDCNGAPPPPSIDTSWGTGGAVAVCSGELTGPVLDSASMNVYVGCSDGKLYSVSQTGAVKSIVVGDGVASKTYGAVVDPPIVDSVNGFVYAVSGSANGGANGVVVQAKTDFSSSVAVVIGSGNQCNNHSPAFNNTYYTSPTASGALIYVAGVSGTVSQPCTPLSTGGALEVYGVTFGTSGVMTSGTPAYSFEGGTPGNEWAPLLEFYNSTTGTDWLFGGVLCNPPPNMGSSTITSGFPGGFGAVATAGLGTSAMIVDNYANTTTYPQAASIYLNALWENAACNNTSDETATGGCAVKLTQAGLE